MYSLFFGILAYPPSGTPFVDHHAAFFMLAGAYLSIIAMMARITLVKGLMARITVVKSLMIPAQSEAFFP